MRTVQRRTYYYYDRPAGARIGCGIVTYFFAAAWTGVALALCSCSCFFFSAAEGPVLNSGMVWMGGEMWEVDPDLMIVHDTAFETSYCYLIRGVLRGDT